MKKILVALIFILALNVPVWAENIPPHVTAYGTATVDVTPDEMFWFLKVTNIGPSIKDLAEQHSNIVLTLLSFIRKQGVLEDDTQTSMMQFGENWGHQNGRRVQNGYFASSQVTFKLTDFSKYQQLWTGLSKFQDMSIQNIGYDYSKRIEAQDKARIAALLVAQKKAHTMAETLNMTLGNPMVIEDNPSFSEPQRSNMMMATTAGFKSGPRETGGFALGKISIRSKTKVVYQLMGPK